VELANSAISSEVNDNTVHKADGDNGAAATAMETSLTN
jgi:pyruvate/2-oxoacid:ferredoxin oxidoreductase beta subunit